MNNLQNFNAKELALKHVYLMQEIEELPPGSNILIAKKKEIEALEDELRKRLYRFVSSDILPIKTIATISPRLAKKLMIPFHFEVFSSMNTKIDRFKIEALTKKQAWIEAREKARTYPGNIHLKIS